MGSYNNTLEIISSLGSDGHAFWRNAQIVGILFYLGYNYIIGNALYQRLPANVSMNIRRFKSSAFVLIIMVFSTFLPLHSTPLDWHNWANYMELIIVIIVFYCAFSIAIFIIKAITSIELGRAVKYEDYIDLIFFSMVLPFGVWVIQARVKRIFE